MRARRRAEPSRDGAAHRGEVGALRVRERREDLDGLQEVLRAIGDVPRAVGDHHVSERFALERPEHAVLDALDGGRARRVVKEGELAEGVAGVVRAQRLLPRLLEVHLELSRVDEVEVVTVLALLDHEVAGLARHLDHRVDHVLLLLSGELLEQPVALRVLHDALPNPILRVLRLWVRRRSKRLLEVGRLGALDAALVSSSAARCSRHIRLHVLGAIWPGSSLEGAPPWQKKAGYRGAYESA